MSAAHVLVGGECGSGSGRATHASPHSPDLECQLGHTYPLWLASFPPPFFYFNILPLLSPPRLKPMRAAVHSRKRSEPFLLLFSATPPTHRRRHCPLHPPHLPHSDILISGSQKREKEHNKSTVVPFRKVQLCLCRTQNT